MKFKHIIIGILTAGVIAGGVFFILNDERENNTTETSYIEKQDTSNNSNHKNKNEDALDKQVAQDDISVPDKKTLPGGKHVFQTFNNCGPASLSMALSYYNIDITQQQLGNQLRPYQNPEGDNDDKSVTVSELAKKAEDYGFITYHLPAGNMEIIRKFISIDIPVITRAWLNLDEDIGHYRLVKGYDKNKGILIQDDSLQGKNLKYSYQDFNDLWQAFNYEFLVIVPEEKDEKAKNILGEMINEEYAWEKALNLANEQLENDPDSLYANFNKIRALYRLGSYQEAVDIFESVKERLPRRMLWYQIEPILAYYQLEDYDKVMQITQEVFDSQNRAFSELHFLRGNILEKQGKNEEAQEEYDLARRYNIYGSWKVNLEHLNLENLNE